MKPTTLNEFIGRLVEIGFVAQSKPIRTVPLGHNLLLVEVGDTGKTSAYIPEYENSLRHYIDTFDEGKYSLLLHDGSMVFIKYRLKNTKITWHRFSYLPSIRDIDVLEGEGVGDLPSPDLYMNTSRKALVRFEYAPEEAGENHPASHLHVNIPNCRIPVTSRLGIAEFLHFVVEHFHPRFYEDFQRKVPSTPKFHNDLAEQDLGRYRIAVPHL
ncbi:DUF2290 domain-containing protein [Chelativorans sp. M5D2P16]|uniref:DUF2290 domain-containing protein n=1 Tax=Chelativorans sp. M5D2P16 TaxID=3095678 RepID=UPI002ACA0445|nr:DUF2290 domain-containing protein [Chelativorans sp. M5D2P16]MDZ5700139.1 DUF2290 domain-containing protein [Chelativorans sp. M5D2P16]